MFKLRKRAYHELVGDEGKEKKQKKRISKVDDPKLLNLIKKFIEEQGFYSLKPYILQKYLSQHLPESYIYPPSLPTIDRMLKKHFHLRYRSFDTAKIKYMDPTYNDKRKWVSRLLAQFLHDDMLVISIDESGFRSDTA